MLEAVRLLLARAPDWSGSLLAVFVADEVDFERVFGSPGEDRFELGTPRDMDVPIRLNLRRFVERSNGVFGKSGTGKSFLTRLLLCGVIKSRVASNLIWTAVSLQTMPLHGRTLAVGVTSRGYPIVVRADVRLDNGDWASVRLGDTPFRGSRTLRATLPPGSRSLLGCTFQLANSGRATANGGTGIQPTANGTLSCRLPGADWSRWTGVGNSGMGKSHGFFGFEAFSNARGVLEQARKFTPLQMIYPPFTPMKKKIIDLLLRFLKFL